MHPVLCCLFTPSQRGEHDDATWERLGQGKKRLVRYVINAKGETALTPVATGADVKRELFESAYAYIFDAESEIFVWIGRNAGAEERRRGLQIGQVRPSDAGACG